MDKEKVKEKDGKVFSLGNVECNELKRDKNYKIECYPYGEIGDTGLLLIGKLISCKEEEPEFTFRWDEREEALDVDIDRVDSEVKEKFKGGKDGYEGHHSKKLNPKDRVFELNVKVPDKDIFHGQITVPVKRKIAFIEKLDMRNSDKLTSVKIRSQTEQQWKELL